MNLLKSLESLLGLQQPEYAGLELFKDHAPEVDEKVIKHIMLKGGKGGSAPPPPPPQFRSPRQAPEVEEAATQTNAVTGDEEAARKKEALRLGAKSLQIPTTIKRIVSGQTQTGQVGTGAAPKK